jgi:hypothetical protein
MLHISGKVTGVGQIFLLLSHHSSICIVSVFLDIPTGKPPLFSGLSLWTCVHKSLLACLVNLLPESIGAPSPCLSCPAIL